MSSTFGWVALTALSAGLVIGCGATRRNVDEAGSDAQGGASAQGGTSGGARVVVGGSSGAPTDSGGSISDDPREPLLGACTQLGEKWCERIEACSPAELASRYGASAFPGVTSCVATERDRCFDWFSTIQGVANSVEAVLAAAPTSCAEAFDYYPPYRTGEAGGLARGRSCLWDEQCSTGFCARNFEAQCGSCDFPAPGPEPQPGQACPDGACPAPFACHEMICKVRPDEGQPCLQFGTVPSPIDFCAEGLLCAAGTCVAPLFFGAACATDDDHCDVLHGLTCQQGKCELATPLHVEGPCGGYPNNQGSCGAGDTCVFIGNPAFDDRPGRCQPRKTGAGSACTGPTDCPSGLQCVPGGDIGSVGGSGNMPVIGFCHAVTVSTSCE